MVSPVSSSLFIRSVVLGSVFAGALVLACGGSSNTDPTPGSADAGPDRMGRLPAPLHPAASCPVTIDTPELLPSPHIPEGTPAKYSSNPPSSGPHFPVWATFSEIGVPFDDGYLVHSLEHGAVALLYKCEGAACPPILEALRKIRDSLPTDPRCDPAIRVRVVIAPYPKMDVPIAAVAWGWTYKAECVDVPTLTQFAKDNYAHSPEDICAAGRTF